MEMERRNTILAAVIGIAILAAAAGGILSISSGPNTADVTSEGQDDIRPMGPAGTITSAEVQSAAAGRSNASALSELRAELNATSNTTEEPDLLMKVGITNNRDSGVTLNATGFMAVLDNGSRAQALNDRDITIGPNETAFPVLAFRTNGCEVRSAGYSEGPVPFSISIVSQDAGGALPVMVTARSPSGCLTVPENLSFASLAAWNITANGSSPIDLRLGNGSAVLAVMAVTNKNASIAELKATDLWLDVGNDTWVRGDAGMNNNLPSFLGSDTTVPFLIGFRLSENMTASGKAYYWPDQGPTAAEIPLRMESAAKGAAGLALWSIWGPGMKSGGNASDADNATAASDRTGAAMLKVRLLAIGDNASVSGISGVRVWTLKGGAVNVTPAAGKDGRSLDVSLELAKGDVATLVQYEMGGETRFVWLRPLVARK